MNFALGLLILSQLVAEGPAGCEPSDPVAHKVTALTVGSAEGPSICERSAITYAVRVIKVNGLEWRGTFFAQLQPIASKTGGTVWTASRETADRLAELDPKGWKAPRITAVAQGLAHLSDRANCKVASGLSRTADGPFDHATQVAYTPQYEEIRDGLALTMSGRKLDQGVLACVVLDECRVATVHHVALSEHVSAKVCCASDTPQPSNKIASRIDVPEVVHASLAGEWLIPNDGVLVLSLGVQTTADPAGKAVVAERLMLIEATAVADSAVERASLSQPLPDVLKKRGAATEAGIPMPMPAMPDRSLPQALNADGSPTPLPPLPNEFATPSSLPGSSEPCASPQVPHHKLSEPTTLDTASARAGFTPAPTAKPAESEASDGSRPYVLRFPVSLRGMNVEFEIRMVSPCPVLETLQAPATSR